MTSLADRNCVPCRDGVPPLKSALAFVNRIGELAEQQGHHPDILLGWGKVEVTTWTHAVNGLTESDFILAAKIDGLK